MDSGEGQSTTTQLLQLARLAPQRPSEEEQAGLNRSLRACYTRLVFRNLGFRTGFG